MNQKKYELTQSGLDKLKSELDYLKNVKRNENLKALKEAREQGDLSENADYSAARNEQSFIESRILEIQNILKNVTIINASDGDGRINIGKKVWIKFHNDNKEQYLELVGVLEVDPFENKISMESPLGQSLKGHLEGDQISFKTDTGKIFNIEILKVD
ncbi:transcription elongation factor [Candidatus Phytoplasma luffae]|uniref:Transcription elongation factor GreA n=1 Tax=Loofah witches'-broom phytoplasma TaxID=35773 RepID=A0A975FIR0_LOWBP|nr:transcription elongation factor GreA [Candidatus Phytoplasma luffae]QTX02664.1 transcription elongation factor [Candidatus Phytoplasma luffae]